ncbi:MAG: UDP-galactopyranose mutase [Pseudomonadota bacterium]
MAGPRHIAIAGAGFSGAVTARAFAEAGLRVDVFETRAHVAGNCHTERDAETGVMVHVYGPHIFHTGDDEVWDYVRRFASFEPYRHRVQTTVGGRVYGLPMNLMLINQFFGTAMGPEEARRFIAARADGSLTDPQSFEEQALAFVGAELYEAFFKGYTEKQWGLPPSALPAAILKRLPLRYTYDDSYFSHPHQGIPREGYTALVAAILDHPGISVYLGTPLPAEHGADHVIYTGPLDAWFGHDLGRLGYRTLDFERFTHEGDYQGTPVMNYGDAEVPHTRITEHKHFAPWECHEGSVLYRETARQAGPDDIPYYPIRLVEEKALLSRYVARARAAQGVSFAGRLATYRYLDMDVTIREALDLARACLAAFAAGERPPVFSAAPL